MINLSTQAKAICENLDNNKEFMAAKQVYDLRVQEFEKARVAMEKAQDTMGTAAAKALTEKSLATTNGDIIYLCDHNLTFCNYNNEIIYISANMPNEYKE